LRTVKRLTLSIALPRTSVIGGNANSYIGLAGIALSPQVSEMS